MGRNNYLQKMVFINHLLFQVQIRLVMSQIVLHFNNEEVVFINRN
jgi:alpha-N-acetylglucosamine transferase